MKFDDWCFVFAVIVTIAGELCLALPVEWFWHAFGWA